ncbi:hypothetical protein Tco_1185831 [Tanacetum coccineum]
MEDLEQSFVEYASLHTDEAGGKWYTFKPEQNNLGDTYNPTWKSHPNLRWRQPQNSQNNFSNPPNRFQPNGSIPNHSFNNRPQNFNNQLNIEGLVSEFMASQDARLSKFAADFQQQQSEMTNKIDTVLKAITDRIAGTLSSDTVKNPKLRTHPFSFARSYPTMDPQCSTQIHSSINTITIYPKQQSDSRDDKTEENEEEKRNSLENHSDSSTPPDLSISFITEKVLKFNSLFESLRLVPPSPNAKLVCTKEEDEDVMFIEIILRDENSHKEEPEPRVQEVEYFNIFPTRSELAYHKYLMCGLIPSIFLRNPIIIEGSSLNLKIPCNISHVHLPEPERILNRRRRRRNRRVPFDPRNNLPKTPRIVYPSILNINHFHHFLDTLKNLFPMDVEPMWATDRVVASTPGFAITIPETANEFAIKGNHLTLVKGNQFDGRTKTDPHKHIHEFLEICDMFKYRDTENEAVRLMMFPLSLIGEAKTCSFRPTPQRNLSFSLTENESLTDAWLRMKEMLQNCHGQNLSNGNIIKIFYHGLSEITQEVLNAAAGGIFLYKTPNQAYQLFGMQRKTVSVDAIEEILGGKIFPTSLLDECSKDSSIPSKQPLLRRNLWLEFDEFMAMTADETP